MTRSQRHQAEITGYCSRDTTVAQGAWSPCTLWPEVLFLDPAEAVVGDADIDVHIYGRFFSRESRVVVEVVRDATFISDTEMIITVQPSKISAPIAVPITVQTGWFISNPVDFSFVAPPPLSRQERHYGSVPEA